MFLCKIFNQSILIVQMNSLLESLTYTFHGDCTSVKNSSNKLNFTKKMGEKRALFQPKNGQNYLISTKKRALEKKIQNFFLEIFLIFLPFQMDFYLTL